MAKRYFGLGYYPASWQASVFAEDHYMNAEAQQDNQFTSLSNALRLNYNAAEEMLNQFKTEYPNFKEANTIDFDIANYYFNNEKYRYALKWYARVVESQLPKLSLSEFNFNKGYTLFSAKRFKQAKPYLEKVKENKEYESDAYYYLGHIAYQLDDYDSASGAFNRISDSKDARFCTRSLSISHWIIALACPTPAVRLANVWRWICIFCRSRPMPSRPCYTA